MNLIRDYVNKQQIMHTNQKTEKKGFVIDGRDIGSISDSAGDFVLPVMEAPTAVQDNILMFKIIASILILVQVLAVSLIATRLRGGGFTSAVGQMIQLLWVAAIASLVSSFILDGASSMFST